MFLIAYYRVLGLIAIAGLVVYGLYFYALIKLIPITLTLPGIAGLILTIGVAADANIVIFERVKEEIRAGRSIRQGIVTGYRKGLTAIIDANVVTIMTAFILFVLATSDVQGFAFTLGIGTFVSLFTAVMATQAILTTMGSSRMISQPVGARGGRQEARLALRLHGRLAVLLLDVRRDPADRRARDRRPGPEPRDRLHLGHADHGRPRARARASQQVSSRRDLAGRVETRRPEGHRRQDARPQRLPDLVQAAAARRRSGQVQSALQSRSSGSQQRQRFNYTSVGPTFGKTVANSAVIAIIASLLVISAYVALRFEWKFAVPVLIALTHDLLITSGVYALTGREVTTATVAALLTILGYSLYDTIIVFDRVRENIPRMPRAAFSQIVNRSMSEVLTRSLATTSCTLMPIIALLLFGGATARPAHRLRVRAADRRRLRRLLVDLHRLAGAHALEGARASVPPPPRSGSRRSSATCRRTPTSAADVEPTPKRVRARRPAHRRPSPRPSRRPSSRQMKRDLGIERAAAPGRRTSTLTKRLSQRPRPTRRRRRRAPAQAAPARPALAGARPKPADGAPAARAQTAPASRRRRAPEAPADRDRGRLPRRRPTSPRTRASPAPAPKRAAPSRVAQPPAREAPLMGMLAWVMMGLALWHFTIWLPDRFWGGIVGAFIGALVGAVLFGLIVNGFSDPRPPRHRSGHGARGDPGRADRPGARVPRGRPARAGQRHVEPGLT